MSTELDILDRNERAAIDESCRGPVLYAFGAAIFWLVLGSLFGVLAAVEMHTPTEFAGHYSWLSFGRVRTIHLNAVAYGWSSLAGVGVSIWLMARLCRTKLKGRTLIFTGITLWNLALLIGAYGILNGDMVGIEWLEVPKYATPLLFGAYAITGIWVVYMFTQRQPGHVYVSQWYLILAFFTFPWLYGTTQLLLIFQPVSGVVVAAVNWWFGHNALGLWFSPIALAAAYYFIPKVLGKPIHSYYLSVVGFWTFVFFYNWAGIHHLIGGPVPAWMITVSVVGSTMMIIPVTTVAINHHLTMKGNFEALRYSPTLRFVVFGAMAYTLVSLQGVTMAWRSLNTVTHFTDYTIGHSHLGLYGFFSMIMFGSIYYIVPRLIQWEWPSANLIRVHFWFTAIGITFMFCDLSAGGLLEGLSLLDEKVPFMAVVDMLIPFRVMRSLAGIMMTIGHLAFAISFVMMMLRLGKKSPAATLLQARPEEAAVRS